jgi:hypothetical protein
MTAAMLWPIAAVIAVAIVSRVAYLTSDARKAIDQYRADKAERDARRAHELAVEREKTLRAQTTFPWPTDTPENIDQ